MRQKQGGFSMRTATVVLADTHQLFLQGLRLIVEARQEFTASAMVTDGFEALEACRQKMPSLLIIDSTIPGLDALEVSRQLGRYSSRTRVLLTMPVIQHERMAQAAKCGVHGAVLKTAGVEQLYNSIDAVMAGQARFPAELTPAGSQYVRTEAPEEIETPYSRLTARERTIFKLLAEGASVKQVAHRLSLKPKTVDVHKTNLMRKLDVHDRGELIHFAFREGLLNIAAQPGV
jgi:DNA-binding NarL/FixJ family response regulator